MYINNELRDLVYKNNLLHGFWDNIRPYEEFAKNLSDEFEEAMHELMSKRKPTETYYSNNKLEGAPTELADIIIFILDYFGGSEPQIDIDENFLETPDEYYKNPQYYEQARKKEPWKYFLEIEDICKDEIAMSALSYALHKNNIYVDESGKKRGVSIELHRIIKLVLEFCDIYGIDMQKNLIDKINYNNSRPKDYRKIGKEELLETDERKVFTEMLRKGYGMYKETDDVIAERNKINQTVCKKRETRKKLEERRRRINDFS